MRTDAEAAGAQWATKDDPRVTRIGRFIRKVRIDELPQAWSVLRGEMSFVGPRPERPEFVAELEEHLPYYAERHMVKPGDHRLGADQLSLRGFTADLRNKLEYDLYYAKNYTPFLDLLILFQTLRVVLWARGSAFRYGARRSRDADAGGLADLYLAGAISAASWPPGWPANASGWGPHVAPSTIAALLLTALWMLSVLAAGDRSQTAIVEAVRNIAWLVVTYRLFATDGRHESIAQIRPVVAVLIGVEILRLVGAYFLSRVGLDTALGKLSFDLVAMLRLFVAVGGLVLVHNLFAGVTRESQGGLRWVAAGMVLGWAVDLNLHTVAYLSGSWPTELAATRALGTVLLSCLIAIGASQARGGLRFRPSRAVPDVLAVLVIGLYLVGMVTIAQWLSLAGNDFARLIELSFLTVASVLAIILLPSRRMRGWLKVTLASISSSTAMITARNGCAFNVPSATTAMPRCP